MNITCDIIRDLLPSYVDEICSEDSKKLIEEHLEVCENCRQQAAAMKTPVAYQELSLSETEKAQEPFKKIKKKNFFHVLAAVIFTGIICICCGMVIQEVGVVHDFFFPFITASTRSDSEITEWKELDFEGERYLNFDSVFYNKEVTNHANSNSNITIRIKDIYDTVIVPETIIKPGHSFDLNALHKYTNYVVEIKDYTGHTFLNFT